jgi:hypothetical protein
LSRYESLECLVGPHRIAVPVRDLDRVVELSLCPPPPLAQPWIAALGLVEDRPVVCVGLPGGTPSTPALAKGLLLKAPGSSRRYVLLVDEVRSIASVEAEGFEPAEIPGWSCPGGWLEAREAEGATLLRLDTDAAAKTLFGSQRDAALGSEALS